MYNIVHMTKRSYTHKDNPWFLYKTQETTSKHVVIIGGGLAGCQSAWALAKRGYQVTLIERHKQLAQEASGNQSGVIYGKFSPNYSLEYDFYQQAYLHALQHIPTLMGKGDGERWNNCGVLQLALSLIHI